MGASLGRSGRPPRGGEDGGGRGGPGARYHRDPGCPHGTRHRSRPDPSAGHGDRVRRFQFGLAADDDDRRRRPARLPGGACRNRAQRRAAGPAPAARGHPGLSSPAHGKARCQRARRPARHLCLRGGPRSGRSRPGSRPCSRSAAGSGAGRRSRAESAVSPRPDRGRLGARPRAGADGGGGSD